MSIICGALRWLKDHETRERFELNETVQLLKIEKEKLSSSGDDWLSSQSQDIEITKKLQTLQLEINKINKNDEKIAKLKSQKKDIEKNKFKSNEKKEIEKLEWVNDENEEDTEFLLEDNINLNLDDESDNDEEVEDAYEGIKV